MTPAQASTSGRSEPAPLGLTSPTRERRRNEILDAAAEMVAVGAIDEVTMEAVAERVGVSRALVYKHFANRRALLSDLYERESGELHAELTRTVQQCGTLDEMLRALVQGALRAQAARGTTLAALTSGGGPSQTQRARQRRRDARTLGYFSRQAVIDLELDESVATAGLALALDSIAVVLSQWRRRPTADRATQLTDTFVTMTMGGLRALRGGAHFPHLTTGATAP